MLKSFLEIAVRWDKVYLFSLEKGYLMLSNSIREAHHISFANVTIIGDDSCFGPTFLRVNHLLLL